MHRAPANNVLVTAFSNQIFGVDIASGQIVWQVVPPSGYGEVELAIEEGVVIAANANCVTFIDYASGHVHASVPIPGEYGRRPTMIVSGGRVFVARNGEVSCLTTRGQPVWVQPFTGKGIGSVALGVPGNIRQADDVGSK
jgi:outer membrane protein assembly factor BamB